MRLTAYASGPGGNVQYTLQIETSDILNFESASAVSVNQLGVPVSWDLRAVQAGDATLQVWVNYEKEICIPTHCFYQFTNAYSGLISIKVTDNVAPTVTAIDEQYGMSPWDFSTCGHEPAHLSLDPIATFTDLATGDTHTAAIDWGDGTLRPGIVTEGGGSGTVLGDHLYFGDGHFVATITVTDNHGDAGDDALNVFVFHGDPSPGIGVIATNDRTVDEGASLSLDPIGTFTYLCGDPHASTIDWGDGAVRTGDVTESGFTGTISEGHIYTDDGVFSVTVSVNDVAGGNGADSLMVTVDNVDPKVDAGPDQTSKVGDTVSFNGSFGDLGLGDTHTIHWDFGNGTVATDGLTPTHVYNDTREITITLTVTDDDGGVGPDSLKVVALSEDFRTATATLIPTQTPTLTEPLTATPTSGGGCTASTGAGHMVDGSWVLLGLVWSGLVLVSEKQGW